MSAEAIIALCAVIVVVIALLVSIYETHQSRKHHWLALRTNLDLNSIEESGGVIKIQ